LEGKRALGCAGGGDEGLFNLHGVRVVTCEAMLPSCGALSNGDGGTAQRGLVCEVIHAWADWAARVPVAKQAWSK
jgi:hypothetical protein